MWPTHFYTQRTTTVPSTVIAAGQCGAVGPCSAGRSGDYPIKGSRPRKGARSPVPVRNSVDRSSARAVLSGVMFQIKPRAASVPPRKTELRTANEQRCGSPKLCRPVISTASAVAIHRPLAITPTHVTHRSVLCCFDSSTFSGASAFVARESGSSAATRSAEAQAPAPAPDFVQQPLLDLWCAKTSPA